MNIPPPPGPVFVLRNYGQPNRNICWMHRTKLVILIPNYAKAKSSLGF
jgi:hypothetical protein